MEELKKELEDLQAALSGRSEELQELQNLLEVKSREADESMDKSCSLILQVHKLEEANEALTARLERLSANGDAAQRRRSTRKSAVKPQEEKLPAGDENTAPSTPLRSPQGSKRGHGDPSDKGGAQEALRNLTKKIKATAAKEEQEDEDFRPEGLPELVQRGAEAVTCLSQTHLKLSLMSDLE